MKNENLQFAFEYQEFRMAFLPEDTYGLIQ
jgi:hypothetical protein